MKTGLLGLFLFFGFILSRGSVLAGDNLIINGYLDIKIKLDNLWDGVDSSGNLRFYRIDRDILESGTRNTRAWFAPKPSFIDINNDGLRDLIVSDTQGTIFVFLNKGNEKEPSFENGIPVVTHFGECARSCLSDWNNDGKVDILCGRLEGDVLLALNKGSISDYKFINGTEDPTAPVETKKLKEFERFLFKGRVLDIGRNSSPCVADFNNDRIKDLVLGEGTYSANAVHLFLNKDMMGGKIFDEDRRQVLVYGEGREHLTPEAVDWDNDGDLDIVVGMRTGHIELFINENGPGNFTKPMIFAGRFKTGGGDIKEGEMSTVYPADWDNDGLIDLITGSSSGYIHVYRNTGQQQGMLMNDGITIGGKDVLKEYYRPAAWRIEARSSWAVMETFSEPEAPGTPARVGMAVKYAYNNSGLDDRGSEGDYIKITSERFNVTHGKKYTLSFDYKGDKIIDSTIAFWAEYGKGVVKDGQKIEQTVYETFKFSPAGKWRTFKKTINVEYKGEPEIPEHAMMHGDISFHIKSRGNGVIYLDNVSLEAD